MPTWLRLQKKTLLLTTRIKSLSIYHPIKVWINNALCTCTMAMHFVSPLENFFKQFSNLTHSTESIELFIHPLQWLLPIVTNIESQKNLAQSQHDVNLLYQPSKVVQIYTNGSNINTKVGAATFSMTLNETIISYLGSNDHFNIFIAELEDINLGLKQ